MTDPVLKTITRTRLTAALVERYLLRGDTMEGLVVRYKHYRLVQNGQRHEISYRRVRGILLGAGVTLRPQNVPLPPTPPGLVNAYLDGRTIKQLAVTYRMSYSTTRRILLAEGVQLRRRGGHP